MDVQTGVDDQSVVPGCECAAWGQRLPLERFHERRARSARGEGESTKFRGYWTMDLTGLL